MGACFSCCSESKSQSGDSDERTRLIDPVSNTNDAQRVPSETVVSPYQHSLPSKSDEQTMLNKILQQTAMNVIDISTLGPHVMEQNEYLERCSAYKAKIGAVSHLWNNMKPDQCFLQDVTVPEVVLSAQPINNSDYILIKTAASDMKEALADLKVTHTEDLVVPFQIPQKRVVSPAAHSDSHHSEDSELTNDQMRCAEIKSAKLYLLNVMNPCQWITLVAAPISHLSECRLQTFKFLSS